MPEHELKEIARELGLDESRVRFRCSCGVMGPDHGWQNGDPVHRRNAFAAAKRDHKLHSEGRSTSEGDPDKLPGKPYKAPEEEGK